jgi:esterase
MKLNYKSFGQGEPVIILHGLFGTLDNWQIIAKQLAEDYTVFIVDLRNHGRSPHVNEHNYKAMADDIQNFMDENWIYGSHVIGHSMGGKTAMRLALDYPDLVRKLVIVDMGVKQNEPGHQTIFEALMNIDLVNLANRDEADKEFQKKIDEFSVRQFLLKNLARKPNGGYEWKMNLPVIHQHYNDILAAIEHDDTFDKPTLFLRGGQSDYVLDEDFPAIQALFPNAKLLTIPQAGHWLHAEAPKPFLEMVQGFLKS